MNSTHRVCITWIGSIEGRVYSGIDEVSPDEAYFLIEDKIPSPRWKEFHEESLKNIIKCFGKKFEIGNKGHKEIIDLTTVNSEGQYKLIFNQIYEIISNTRKKYPDAAITIDTSAAPKQILFVVTFVATTLSTERSPIILLSTEKTLMSNPDYYASDDSEYFAKYIKDKEDMKLSLYEYRKLEKLDPGGRIYHIELPRSNFEILNPDSTDDFRLLAVFSVIPSYKDEPSSSNKIAWTVFQENPNLFKGFIQPPLLKNGKQNDDQPSLLKNEKQNDDNRNKNKVKKENNDKDESRPFKILVGKKLEKLEKLGLINLQKPGKIEYAKKTWGGDLISGATDKLHKNHKEKITT